jgi:SMI1 / KNR4 family (SUKH-1)
MLSRDRLSEVAHLKPGCSDTELRDAEGALGFRLPESYVELLKLSNGLHALNDRVVLFSASELDERNSTYEVGEYAPGWVMIGDDSGGRAILLNARQDPIGVFIVGTGSMVPDDAEQLAPTIESWLDRGLPYEPTR